VNFVLQPFLNKGSFTLSVCDAANDGKETINLTIFENQLKTSDETFEYYVSFSDLKNGSTNKILNPNAYSFDENSGIFKFFVKIISSTACPNYAEINLVLNKVPAFDIENFWICPKDVLPFLQPDFSSYPFNVVTYEWKNAVGTVISSSNAVINLAAGKYTLTITDDKGCSFTNEFEVLEKEIPVITKLETNGNDYTVIATGSKKILYSIDGISWKESNLFTNLPKGKVTFYVKFEDDNCIGEAKDGLVLQFPNSFTPNGDGINDVWMIIDVAFFGAEKSVLSIYDRYGNLVFRQDKAGILSWDGLSNGRKLPTASYWFHIALPDGRDFKGWVLLKNRN
jgi:gliding motility-associated-like protein